MATTRLHITCRFTGIQGTLDLPPVPNKTLEYTHPLAHMESCHQVLDMSMQYIRRLDNSVLAGLIITTLRHYKLYSPHKSVHPAAINAALCTAKRSALLKLVHTIKEYLIPAIGTLTHKRIPHVNLNSIPDEGCTLWVVSVAKAILHDICNVPVQEVESDLSDEDKEVMRTKSELAAKRTAEVYKQVEIRREQRAELDKVKRLKTMELSLSDLVADYDEANLVLLLKQHGVDKMEPAITTLYNRLLEQGKGSFVLNAKQVTMLKHFNTSLFTMSGSDRTKIIAKMREKGNKYTDGVATLLEICSTYSDSVVDKLSTQLETITKPTMSLREKLAAMRGAK